MSGKELAEGEVANGEVVAAASMRDRRRDFVSGEIRRAALRLFAERTFDDVTVDDIAAAAGIAPRTFFRYFASKDDVVLHYRQRLDDRLIEALALRPSEEGAVAALREAFISTSTLDSKADRSVVLQLGQILADAPDLRARANGRPSAEPGRIVAQLGARMGVPASDPRPAVIAAAMSAVASQTFDRWVTEGGLGDPAHAIRAALALLETGLSQLDMVAGGA